MRNFTIILGSVIVIGFIYLGISNIVSTNNKLHLKEIQLKSASVKLDELESKYKKTNDALNKATVEGKTSKEELEKLRVEKEDLDKKRIELEAQLQAKLEAKNKIASASQTVINTATNTQVASAASYPISSNAAKAFIYQHESGNNPGSINAGSGACGLGQALPCSKLPCSLSDYACQDNWFTNNYMIPRYGSWENAYAFWQSHKWW